LAARIRALRSKDQGGQNVAEKNRTKGVSPTAVFRSPSRYCGEAYTVLLGEVKIAILFLIISKIFFFFENASDAAIINYQLQ
jgi:hypothetical protein